ncbi:F-box protein At4g35930 isoform X2 [Rhododendron vialii]|nr:F-box protein At4g35930 isoform X2 [Rhododendron vialii]XP_058179748.1 F-box protein At4g35930 isoform X2 [Rhododendron vialii]XP_058179749.1 F-box protein At4g35930 isoform X2 [Rhododendron vialii]
MGKVALKDKKSKTPKQKRRMRNSSNKYLKPGALAQLRYNKALAAKSCTDLGKKRVAVLDGPETDNSLALENKGICGSPSMLSPERFGFSLVAGPFDMINNRNDVLTTPKTPCAEEFECDSRLESLPIDLLVKILCHLHHDQLRAVFHVSKRVRKAVVIARQFHFNYTTPDRSRQEMLRAMTPLPTEHWPFLGKRDGKGIWIPSPHTPKAPKHGPRPPTRVKCTEMRQIAAVLFQESTFPSRYMVPSVLAKPLCKSLVSNRNRVLFYEDELCQAVAQNKLR